MDTRSPGFPRELLAQAWTSRLEYFRGYTMAHPRLIAVRDALLAAIQDREPNSVWRQLLFPVNDNHNSR